MNTRQLRGGDWIVVSVYRHLPTQPRFWRSIMDWFTAHGLRRGEDFTFTCRDDWTFANGVQTLIGQEIDFQFSPKAKKLAMLFKLTWG